MRELLFFINEQKLSMADGQFIISIADRHPHGGNFCVESLWQSYTGYNDSVEMISRLVPRRLAKPLQ